MAYYDKYGVQFSDNRKTLIKYPEDFQGDYVISDGVTSIGVLAFYNCRRLKSIIIPNSVTSIGNGAFNGCSGLTSVTIPNSITSIENHAFQGCSSLTSVTIPNSVTSIGDSAFSGCSSLKSLTIPSSVTSIGDSAFSGCSSLKSLTIPKSVISIGDFAFSDCQGFVEIIVENGNAVYDNRENCNAIIETATNTMIVGCKNTVFPSSVTSIGDFAFSGCSDLTSITIPANVENIGVGAFNGCCHLTKIFVENANTVYDSRNNCNAIIETSTNSLIVGCKNTIIPNSVTSIGDFAFGKCSDFISIIIPNSVTSIGDFAFSDCSDLTLIIIPDSVTSIGAFAFSDCSDLTLVIIQDSVTAIGCSAFKGCSSLTSITIPNSVTNVGDGAFNCCSGLTSIAIGNSITKIEEWTFLECSKLNTIIVPLGQKTRFAQMEGLKFFKDKIIEKNCENIAILFHLAKAYELGIGVSQNSTLALLTYIHVAEKRIIDAAYHLGEWYSDGEIVPKELNKALAYFKQAAIDSFKDAIEHVNNIKPPIYKKQNLQEMPCRNKKKSDEKEVIHALLKVNNVCCFYHFTSRKNVESIRKNGGLYSWIYLKKHKIEIPVQGGGELSQDLDQANGIANYVHLSFCEKHPMSYRLIQDGEDIVVLKISTEVALLDGTMFSNMNAVDKNAKRALGLEGLLNVNIDATKEEYLTSDDPLFKYKQAEVMVKTCVPSKYILNLDDF